MVQNFDHDSRPRPRLGAGLLDHNDLRLDAGGCSHDQERIALLNISAQCLVASDATMSTIVMWLADGRRWMEYCELYKVGEFR